MSAHHPGTHYGRPALVCLVVALVVAATAGPAAAAGWEEQSSGMGGDAWLEPACAISADEAWIGVDSPATLLHTTDGGAGWYGVGVPISGDLQSIAFLGQTGWVAAYDYGSHHMYDVYTTDGGANWVDRPPATGTVDRFLPTSATTCWGWRNLGSTPKLQYTTDGGQTWAGNTAWTTGGYDSPQAGSFVTAQTGWFVAGNKVYRTTDGGGSWAASDPAPITYASTIDFCDATTGWVAGGDGWVARSTDGGQNWTPVPLPMTSGGIYIEAIDFVLPATGFAITNQGTIWRTTDGGATWTADSYRADWIPLDVAAADATHAWICGTQGKILHTGDGGGPFDTTPPAATASGPTTWVGVPSNVTITVDDGVGIGAWRAQWKWETDVAWSLGWSPADVPVDTPADHSRDGLHTLTYRGIDWAYNVSVDQTVDVGIDTVPPVAKAPSSASVRRLRRVSLKYRIDDVAPNGGHGDAQIVIKNRRGKVVMKSARMKGKPIDTTLKWSFKCKLKKGTYRFYVNVRDEADNYCTKKASNRLTVK